MVVVGGGDGAVQEALVLAKASRQVIIVCRSPLKAKRDYVDRIAARESTLRLGQRSQCDSRQRGGCRRSFAQRERGTGTDIECTGLFPFVGEAPNSGFVPSSLLTVRDISRRTPIWPPRMAACSRWAPCAPTMAAT